MLDTALVGAGTGLGHSALIQDPGIPETPTVIGSESGHGSFSFHDSRTRSADNGDPAVEDLDGQIYSLLFGANYRVSDPTEVAAHYSFSSADFSQGNAADGLPLGIEYRQHSVSAGVATQLSDNLRAQLQYQFQTYEEPTAGGFNDYTAHGVFLNCTLNWK